jgi:transcriptional regulator with XRE-family HTH domain
MNDVEDFYPEFGRRIRLARRRAHLSQDTLGRLTGLNRTSITNIEAGRQRIPLHLLIRFATALEIEPMELLPGDPPPGLRLEGIPDQHRSFVLDVLNAAEATTRET